MNLTDRLAKVEKLGHDYTKSKLVEMLEQKLGMTGAMWGFAKLPKATVVELLVLLESRLVSPWEQEEHDDALDAARIRMGIMHVLDKLFPEEFLSQSTKPPRIIDDGRGQEACGDVLLRDPIYKDEPPTAYGIKVWTLPRCSTCRQPLRLTDWARMQGEQTWCRKCADEQDRKKGPPGPGEVCINMHID